MILVSTNVSRSSDRRRSGQLSWLDENQGEEYQLLNSINARIELFTGLSVQTSEYFQVVNYGLGGHYVPHFDTLSPEHVSTYSSTNIRICCTNLIVFFLFSK